MMFCNIDLWALSLDRHQELMDSLDTILKDFEREEDSERESEEDFEEADPAVILDNFNNFFKAARAEVALVSGTEKECEERQTKKRKLNDEACGASEDNTGHESKEKPKEKSEEESEVLSACESSTELKAAGGDAGEGNGTPEQPDDLIRYHDMFSNNLPSDEIYDFSEDYEERILNFYVWSRSATEKRICWSVHEAGRFAKYVFEKMLGDLQQRLLNFMEPLSGGPPLGRKAKYIIDRARSAADEPGVPSHFVKFYRDFIRCLELPIPAPVSQESWPWRRYCLIQQIHEYYLFDTHRQLVKKIQTSETQNFLARQGFKRRTYEKWRDVLERYLNNKLQLHGRYKVGVMSKKGRAFHSLVEEFGEGALGFLSSDARDLFPCWEGVGLDNAWQELAVLMPMLDDFAELLETKLVKPLRMGTLKTRHVADAESLSARELLEKVYSEQTESE